MTEGIDEINRNVWERHLKEHQRLYPDERVVVFLAKCYPDVDANLQRRALVVGFGPGRHMKLLMDYGFEVSGIDVLELAVDMAKANFADHPRLGAVKVADMADHPFPEQHFDVIVSWGVAFLRPEPEMTHDLAVMRSMLKPDGRLLVNFRSTDNWFTGKGEAIGPSTYILGAEAGPYADACFTFLDRAGGERLLLDAGFEIENVEKVDLLQNQAADHHSWWVFWARRP